MQPLTVSPFMKKLWNRNRRKITGIPDDCYDRCGMPVLKWGLVVFSCTTFLINKKILMKYENASIQDSQNKKRNVIKKFQMPAAGLEPARGCPQQILSLPRLPFRHAGV